MSNNNDDLLSRLEAEKMVGLSLAICSGVLIGISFIITKKGLMDSNKANVVSGEVANFLAYSFAPAILVTPLGAVSVLVGAILSDIFLKERLGRDGIIGCVLCVLGSLTVILHAPEEAAIQTVEDVFRHFIQPGFLSYMLMIIGISLYLIYYVGPIYGKTHMLVYISICSLVGSISVMAVKGFAVAVKLTFAGENQFKYFSTWLFLITVIFCALTQVNYFNKALDLFSTNRVTPIYYVFFTSATIIASIILGQGIQRSSPVEVVSVLVGFFTTFIGVFMVNDSKAISSGLSERGSAYNISATPRYSKGEFFPLRDFEEPPELDDFIGQSKLHST